MQTFRAASSVVFHSGLMPAVLITNAHLSISPRNRRENSSGVPPAGMLASPSNRSRTSGAASVFNAAAVAMPDAILGERTCAYVILRPGGSLTLRELVAFLNAQQIARFKLPERLEVVDAFPLTGVGKVSKKDLREDITRKLAAEAERGR